MNAHAGTGYDGALMLEEMNFAGKVLLVGAPAALRYQRSDLTRQGGDEDRTRFGGHDVGA